VAARKVVSGGFMIVRCSLCHKKILRIGDKDSTIFQGLCDICAEEHERPESDYLLKEKEEKKGSFKFLAANYRKYLREKANSK